MIKFPIQVPDKAKARICGDFWRSFWEIFGSVLEIIEGIFS